MENLVRQIDVKPIETLFKVLLLVFLFENAFTSPTPPAKAMMRRSVATYICSVTKQYAASKQIEATIKTPSQLRFTPDKSCELILWRPCGSSGCSKYTIQPCDLSRKAASPMGRALNLTSGENKTNIVENKTVSPTATEASNSMNSIKNEMNAKPNEYPYQVRFSVGEQPFCGGTIISTRHILTAAHCFPDGSLLGTITVGDHSIKIKDADEQLLSGESITLHENFNFDTAANDIAIIKLSKPIETSKEVQPVKLPEGDMKPSGDAIATGWGSLLPQKTPFIELPDILQAVVVPIVTNEKCKEAYAGNAEVLDTMICAGFMGQVGKDTCQGDSGGPLTQKQGDGSYILIGITSFGEKCAEPNFPGVYTNVVKYTEWIKSKTT